MTTESSAHETRISRIEGILESVATKDFVRQVNAEMLKDINSKIDSKIDEQTRLIREQTKLFRSEMSEIHQEIKRLNEKQYRLTGAAELIRFSLPIIISVAALLVALFRPV